MTASLEPYPSQSRSCARSINASAHGAAAGAHEQLRVALGYISAQLVPAACIQVPVRRDAVASDGTLSDPEIQRSIAAAIAALVQHAQNHPRALR